VGEHDPKFREIAVRLAAGFPNARIRVIDGVGHAAHLEAPDRFASALLEFLSVVDSSKAIPAPAPVGDGASVRIREAGSRKAGNPTRSLER